MKHLIQSLFQLMVSREMNGDEGMHHAWVLKQYHREDTDTIMRNPLPEICRECFA